RDPPGNIFDIPFDDLTLLVSAQMAHLGREAKRGNADCALRNADFDLAPHSLPVKTAIGSEQGIDNGMDALGQQRHSSPPEAAARMGHPFATTRCAFRSPRR